ncbi:MAG TPA: hypothetical protein PK224_13255 [Nitrospira sp.]|nr:hypothetical protein [Nitrospira sp.]
MQTLTDEVFRRLLIAKGLLGKIRFSNSAQPDRVMLASHILAAHDAAELAAAAIAHHLQAGADKGKTFLMDYLPLIEKKAHEGRQIEGRDYFSQLNDVRVALKHKGILPDAKDWRRVGERTWGYISVWCDEYFGLSLDGLDESGLISDPNVKAHYTTARATFEKGLYKECFEHLALACQKLFDENDALRNLSAGEAKAEDAIKLAAYGVHANDYLALQQFLPKVIISSQDPPACHWEQNLYGHPANWTERNAEFGLRAFVDLTLRIQDADWIPGPYAFHLIYDYKITAIDETVAVVRERTPRSLLDAVIEDKDEVRILKKGNSIRCRVIVQNPISLKLSDFAPDTLIIVDDENITHRLKRSGVQITCVPREDPIIGKYFPDLSEIPYES